MLKRIRKKFPHKRFDPSFKHFMCQATLKSCDTKKNSQ